MDETIFQSVVSAEKNKFPFAAWRLPEEKNIHFISARKAISISINDLGNHKGFVAFPFGKNIGWIIPEEEKDTSGTQKAEGKKSAEIYSKEEYLQLFDRFLTAIKKGKFKKLVLSRIEKRKKKKELSPVHYFNLLSENYPSAFVYYLNLPGEGVWLGATPERLVEYASEVIQTVSLAGTQLYSGKTEDAQWGDKEMNEQELVTGYIKEILSRNNYTNYQVNGPFTVKAGNLIHLKTEFIIRREPEQNISGLIDALQPTPAVCGIPKEEAMKFILEEEYHERSFYSGFIGPVNKDESGQLFVNLRCFQVKDDELFFYAGGGITEDSDGEKEWKETEMKIRTTSRFFE